MRDFPGRPARMSLILTVCLLLALLPAGQGAVVISEFMAINDTVLTDEDGDYSDWLELHNSGSTHVVLDGWYLTDDPRNLARWRLPSVTLAADDYRVVFASGKDRGLPGGELHTNFKLSGSGEYLALTRPDGQTVAHEYGPEYPPQRPDVSYGFTGAEYCYLEASTPGLPNATGCAFFVDELGYSHPHGFYDAPFSLALTCSTAGADIHYTTDGSLPAAATGVLYIGPVTIARTTTLRAAAFKAGYRPSPVVTRTYLFLDDVLVQDGTGWPSTWGIDSYGIPARYEPTYEPIPADYEMDPEVVHDPLYRDTIREDLKSIPSVSLVMHRDDLFDASRGIYANPFMRVVDLEHPEWGERWEWEKPASVELIYPDGRPGFQIDCGIRIHGGASRYPRNTNKHGFRMLFKRQYGSPKLSFPLFGDSAANEFNTLVLKAFMGDAWTDVRRQLIKQYLRDKWTAETLADVGQPSTHGVFVHLYLDGLYWGLYYLFERPDASFMETYFGGDEEEYDVIKSGYWWPGGAVDIAEALNGTKEIWNEVIEMANAGLSGEAEYAALRQWVDVENLIDYMLLNMCSGNKDWIPNNWYAARRRVEGGKFRFFVWDAEGNFWDIDRTHAGEDYPQFRTPGRLYWNLRANSEFRLLFADRVQRHLFNGGALTAEANIERYLRVASEIDRAVVGESARWGDSAREPALTRDIEWIAEQRRLVEEFLPQRTAIALQQFKDADLYPAIDAPVFWVNGVQQHGGVVAAGARLAMSATAAVYYTIDGADPRLPGGAFSPSARVYNGPVTLDQDQYIRARARQGAVWSALNEAVFTLGPMGSVWSVY